MKGEVFTEFLSMADKNWGENSVDTVLSRCPLASKGAYSAVGYYDSSELFTLIGAFSSETSMAVDEMQRRFGHWMLKHFVESYPDAFESKTDTFSFLESIESEIHAEVRKLYPDAELPTFVSEFPETGVMLFTYISDRNLVPFCQGLIEATFEHYGERAEISVDTMVTTPKTRALFTLKRLGTL